jgi:AcrR family transcriptional regulator
MRTSQAREHLLAAAVRHALDAGIADLSLRQIAAAIGTSHRMLIYHFGSREGLLVAVTQAVEDQQRAALLESGATSQDARQAWERFSDPALWPQERLFFELYAYALRGRPGTEGFLDGIVESWVAPIAAALVEAGADESTPASAWPWSAACCWICSPPGTAPEPPRHTNDSSSSHRP